MEKAETMQLRFGIIGAGRIGTLHARNLGQLIPHARVTMVADPRLTCAQAAATSASNAAPGSPEAVHATTDYRDIIASADVDAVVVASSTDTHIPIIEAAAAAGKHIFCEKPIDHDPARIRAALQAVKQAGVRFQVGFNRRFDPDFRELIEHVHAGRVGVPHLVRITSRDPEPPTIEYVKRSGGMFMDMSIHDLDMARAVVSEEIVEVYAAGSCLVDPAIAAVGDIDTAIILLRFANGTLCSIDNSRKAAYGYDQRLEVFGSSGCIVANNNTPTRIDVWDQMGQHQDRPHDFFLERYSKSYESEMQEFTKSIRQQRAPKVNGVDGLQAVLLAQAAQKSLETGRPVVFGDGKSQEDAA
jgi:myo-inositol 2-dehydrogenase/D-chiro-inositol 1-dehydrogenase